MTAKAVTPEREYQRTIVDLLGATGWEHSHTYPLRTQHGWRTGTTAVGWPDLVALRGPWIVAIEVKSDTGRATTQQLDWLRRFAALDSGLAWLVAPSLDIQTLARWLQYPQLAPAVHGYDAG